MKTFIALNGLIAFASSSRLRGILTPTADVIQAPTTIVTQAPVSVPVPTATATVVTPIPTTAVTQVPSTQGYGYVYPNQPYPTLMPTPMPSQPSLSYLQSLMYQNGIQSLINKSVTTNNQNVVANTVASQGSNANTNLNNMAGSFTINGLTVKPGDMSTMPKITTIPTTATPTTTPIAAAATGVSAIIPPTTTTSIVQQQPVVTTPSPSTTAIVQQPTGTLIIH